MELVALVLFLLSVGASVAGHRTGKRLVAGSVEIGPAEARLGLTIIGLRSAQYELLGAALLVLVGTETSWEAWTGRVFGVAAVCIGAVFAWVLFRTRGELPSR